MTRPRSTAYCSPVIDDSSPVAVLAGEQGASIVLRGTSFPLVKEQLTDVRVGGVSCISVELVEPGRSIRCSGLRWVNATLARATPWDADGRGVIGSTWPATGTVIIVAGQVSQATTVAVELVPPPVVESILPTEAGPGETISIQGEGFSADHRNLRNLTIGGIPCVGNSSMWHVSRTELACQIPIDHPLWLHVKDNPGSV